MQEQHRRPQRQPHTSLQHAKIQKLNLPTKSLKQSQRMRIQTIAILTCNVSKIGIAKLVIGIRDDGSAVEYSITNFQHNKTSQFID